MVKLSTSVILILFVRFVCSSQDHSVTTATELLLKVRRAYESAETYTDTVTATRNQGQLKLVSCQVRTDFVRSRSIRVESKCQRAMVQTHHVALQSQGVTQFVEIAADGMKVKEDSSLDNILPALSVRSIGVGPTVIKLLTPEVRVNPMLPLAREDLRPDEIIGGAPVHVVSGTWRGSKVLLRIDKSTLLLRNIEIVDDFGAFEQKTTYEIAPKLNEPIPDTRFQLKPLL